MQSIVRRIAAIDPVQRLGRIVSIGAGVVTVGGIGTRAAIGDRLQFATGVAGEVVRLGPEGASALIEGSLDGLAIGALAELGARAQIAPHDGWLGRVVDCFGNPLDGRPLNAGAVPRAFRAPPPQAAERGRLGARIRTGLAAFDTLLPIVRGQRIGLFAGSGVGKSTLLGNLSRGMECDVAVIALIGERGRELREFVEEVLGPEGMARAVIVAATSDQSPLLRRRCAWAAMTVAEHFRDAGKHVLFMADSITRFAEAHREIALAAGEAPSYRGFPASTAHLIMSLAERAGPGVEGSGDITGIFSVLVAGSDMDEPVADILRGVLDGHVVLDRAIAERGRFPAVDVLRSVSRSLPAAASAAENALLMRARAMLGAYAESELMIRAGLYAPGSDPQLDEAVRLNPAIDRFVGLSSASVSDSFACLATALGVAPPTGHGGT
ncbi:FliI/YscN family ATPase [Paracoccus suum]|uniref:FliI/YscN family ATPase n=1 Tax=Paracoccus suum TaxID=2259340 RepID=A0A344PNN9_9RHOB|nr:FliI/YscN family ATPase [Paracoccus suum]AXC50994.1 FliI/YscN family ATPase [Paracoccus suum]